MNENQIVNELEEIIYVSDIENYNLLYVNDNGKRLMNVQDDEIGEGKKCYEMLQGLTAPCPFCTNHLINRDEFYMWEHSNPYLGNHYLIKDKMITWKGQPARMEIAMDITERENLSQGVRNKLEVEDTIVLCIKRLLSATNLDDAIHTVLEMVAKFYEAERAYICEFNKKEATSRNTYEWHIKALDSKKEERQSIPNLKAEGYTNKIQNEVYVLCDDVKKLKDQYPEEYAVLKGMEINSIMVISFDSEGDYSGYMGIQNYKRKNADIELLNSLSYFIVNEIVKRESQEKLHKMLNRDPLTGLFNRYAYLKDLEKIEKENINAVGIAFVDINGLKRMNDTYGHSYGDDVIKHVGKGLKRHFKDEQVYRLSGDEFVIISCNIKRADFLNKIKKIQEEFDEESSGSIAIGSTWEDQDIDVKSLIHHADELMYINKQEYYKNSWSDVKHHRPKMLKTLLNSLKNKEYEMYLQPKADVGTREIIGAEALVRHNHPEKGIVSPAEFIPLFEKEGSIKYIDFFIFEEVCKTLDRWQKKGKPLFSISLNFSRITIMEKDLIEKINAIYEPYHFSKKLIEIEITETVGEMERETMAEIIVDLKKEGFGISLDDFGTMYTSMSILTIMDLDTIKLDRSLISSLACNEKNQIIVRHIIDICKDLGLHCIAEGVETEDQLKMLQLMRCDAIQGYILSKPIPLLDFEIKFKH